MNVKILSERAYQTWPSWHVVYEWEDIFSDVLKSQLEELSNGYIDRFQRLFRRASRKYKLGLFNKFHEIHTANDVRLFWLMSASSYQLYTFDNVIPLFLDFPAHCVSDIVQATEKLPFYYVTCKDIYYKLQAAGSKNVLFMPLSISDKYYSRNVPAKSIDVIQFGRKNAKLHEWMLAYCKEHNNVDYVYQTSDGSLTYNSTLHGNIGKFDTRKEYMDLMSKCRVSLVSTPGMDNSRNKDFGNIDFFTPRFFESAVHYCHMLGRYTENEEAGDICIKDVCYNIKDQAMFNEIMDTVLAQDNAELVNKYDDFLKMNLTSRRAEKIRDDLKIFKA